jgi:nanoRNase/pAp phosphatase (c-di-AMP/oligoRNAs hydrolase)
MAYFRSLPKLHTLLNIFSRGGRWIILINADPDAMASAMALRRMMSRRVVDVRVACINAITRPDNLAMIRYARLRMDRFDRAMIGPDDHIALVDSQPHHNPLFHGLTFSVVIDHHPVPADAPMAEYHEIRPEYGATSTLLTEHLYNMGVRPGKLLATALQFGIKSDTGNFERHVTEVDIRAYHYLSKFADAGLLSRIARSEFHRRWLDCFAHACVNMHTVGSGQFVYIDEVENPDLLVIIADFFMRVYEFRWVAVSGTYEETAVVIFRGDGVTHDLGRMAANQFGDIGSAGGHKVMARAEFPVSAAQDSDMELFIYKRLLNTAPRKIPRPPA